MELMRVSNYHRNRGENEFSSMSLETPGKKNLLRQETFIDSITGLPWTQ
jgi:hypothetical protein